MSLKNFKKVKKKFFKSCCCCYQTAKTRTLCVCNLKIILLRKKVLNVSGFLTSVIQFYENQWLPPESKHNKAG